MLHVVRNPEAEAQRQIAEARIAELDAENEVCEVITLSHFGEPGLETTLVHQLRVSLLFDSHPLAVSRPNSCTKISTPTLPLLSAAGAAQRAAAAGSAAAELRCSAHISSARRGAWHGQGAGRGRGRHR